MSGSRLLVSDYDFAPVDRDRLLEALRDVPPVLVPRGQLVSALQEHPEAEILCTFHAPANAQALAPGLRWLALPSAGVESAAEAGLLTPASGLMVTNARGIHAIPIGEYVMSGLLLWARHWKPMLEMQRLHQWPDRARWHELRGHELAGATLGIVGLGAIGTQIARFGRGFGMRTVAIRRSGRHDGSLAVDHVYAPSELHSLLRDADYVVIAVPGTPETAHLIDRDALHAMRRQAVLVNIARGLVVDEPALIEALRDGTIAGAVLDVFSDEPLPAASPLWDMPNVLLSPHLSGSSERYSQRFTDLLLENLAHYRAGEPMRNLVDPERGY